jgi:hypothetical protein
MQCERLIKQIKTWYLHVQNETMAPARMISFIENHASHCDICLADPDLQEEISRISEIVLPESKIPKAAGTDQEQPEEDESEFLEDNQEDSGEGEDLGLFDPDDDDI